MTIGKINLSYKIKCIHSTSFGIQKMHLSVYVDKFKALYIMQLQLNYFF